jgi:CubicO group peptidase (beta-lactamase class C family)
MERLLCALFGVLTLAHLPEAQAGCDLDCSLAAMLGEERLTGVVYSIVDGNETHVGAVGVANAVQDTDLRADAKVHVGSVAKTVLALGVLRLATQRRIDLDAPLGTLLPQIQLDNPWTSSSPVTIRHLLDHTAGLDDVRLWHVFSARIDPDAPLGGAFTRDRSVLRVRSQPGRRFSYSNLGYTLAGMVVEAVTGERYEKWLERELLTPLGLHDTTFAFTTQRGPAADARLAWGHHDDLSPAVAIPSWIRPAGQLTTTAVDMARLARFLMSDGRADGAVLVDEKFLRSMGRPITTDAARAGLAVGYALGLATRDRHGAVGLCHFGSTVGFRAALCLYPEQRKAFFIAHNTDSETARYDRFDELFTRALAGRAAGIPTGSEVVPAAWMGRYVPAPARFEAFRYFEMLFDSIELDVLDGHVELRQFGGEPQVLWPVGAQLVRGADRVVASHVLLSDDHNRYLSTGSRTLRQISGASYGLQWASLALGLAGLLAFIVMIPLRGLRQGEQLVQPASIALLLLIAPIPFFALQPFETIGDKTLASIAAYAATLLLPLLLIWHFVWTYHRRRRLGSWPLHLAATVCVLQWCVVLYAWDLLPLALWR